MNSIKELIAYIDNEFNHIDILEKEYGLSAKKLFNTNNSNCDVLLNELLTFLLLITKDSAINELQLSVFSAVTKENMTADIIDTLKQNVNPDITFCSLQLFILADLKNNQTYYDGLSYELFGLYKKLGDLMAYTSTNIHEAAKIKNQYLEKMIDIIVSLFTQDTK